jgi:diaminohydroxyphosphoribosylaminopyrimidine deaminase / 5-amino-6-(5-phosphoribosylamino)uracil reductase
MKPEDIHFMSLALAEARKGKGRTSPNPCVGAVLVREGQLIGRGFHQRSGGPHAEINAIADAGGAAACAGASLYVTLEPCNHSGKTPPCTQAILAAGIQRVVVGMADPNPVAAGGMEFLRSHGIEVEMEVLKQECRQLNFPFIKHVTTGLPWVVMKAGMSLDGRISRIRGQGGAITGPESLQRVHTLRNELDAILIGGTTALIDQPSLTTRLESGEGRDPLRVILDSQLRLPPEAKLLHQQSSAATWIFCGPDALDERQKRLEQAGAVIHRVDAAPKGGLDLQQVLSCLGRVQCNSVLVEGGATVHGAFLRNALVDEAYLFVAPYFIGDAGTPLVAGSLPNMEHLTLNPEMLGKDILLHGLLQTP